MSIDFPRYVPTAVRRRISELIDGSRQGQVGLAAALTDLDAELDRVDALIKEERDGECAAALRRERSKLKEIRAALDDYRACLERLATDSRMRKVYRLLADASLDEEDQGRFIEAASVARGDYHAVRDELAQRAELVEAIATSAKQLAKLLRQTVQLGGAIPDVFFSVPELLLRSDSNDQGEPALSEWRNFRSDILGISAEQGRPPEGAQPDPSPRPVAPEVLVDTDGDQGFRLTLPAIGALPAEHPAWALRRAWQKAPRPADLLDTIAAAARSFRPAEAGFVGAAVATRQRSSKAEYLRAFLNLLSEYQIDAPSLPRDVFAITATVAIDRDDVDVLGGDVQNALKQLAKISN